MKKYAFILLGPNYDPNKHQAEFKLKNNITSIFTVRNYEEAKQKALFCADNGYGVIELCGAFGKEKANEIIDLTENKLGVGFVIHLSNQDSLFSNFFNN